MKTYGDTEKEARRSDKVTFIEAVYSHQSLLSSPVGFNFSLWDAGAEKEPPIIFFSLIT